MNKKAITKDPAHRAEVEATVKALPQDPPSNTVSTLIERGRGGKDALIFKAGHFIFPGELVKREGVRVSCSACGGYFICEKIKGENCHGITKIGYRHPDSLFIDHWDGEFDVCERCGKRLETIHVSRFGKEQTKGLDGSWAMSVHNVRDHLCVLQWIIERRTDKDGRVSYRTYRKEGTLIIDGVCVRVSGELLTYYRRPMELDAWIAREVYKAEYSDWNGDEIIPFDPREIWTSESAHCALEDYFKYAEKTNDRIKPEAYLRLWTRFPHVENLVRSGHSAILNKILAACVCKTTSYYYTETVSFDSNLSRKYIDWKKVKPHEMLRIEKPELKAIDEKNAVYLEIRNYMKDHGIRFTDNLIDLCAGFNWPHIKDIVEDGYRGIKPGLVQLVNYLARQKSELAQSTNFLCDYWRMVEEYQNAIPRELVWPKDLRRAHDEINNKIKQKKDEETQRKIAECFELRKKLSFTDPASGLMIRPAKDQDELIKEGKELHHCVGGYAAQVAKGLTTILFIRKIEEPEKPFYTLEYKDGIVIQNRGDHNRDRTPEVVAFEKRWLEYLASMKKKNRKERISANG